MKRITYCSIIVLLYYSCGQTEKPHSNCQSTIVHFFDWYQQNFTQINQIDIVNNTTSAYRIQFSEAAKYLTALKNSKLFSDNFIKDKMNFFQKSDSEFIKTGQTDGPANGFEADLLLLSQEPENILADKKTLVFQEAKKNENTAISVKWYEETRVFVLNSNCLIDSIYLQ